MCLVYITQCVLPVQDMKNGYAWHARDTSSAERVHHKVEYLATDDHKFLDLDLHIHYGPPSRDTVPDGSGRADLSSYTYSYLDEEMKDYDEDDEDSHVFAQVSKARPMYRKYGLHTGSTTAKSSSLVRTYSVCR